MTRFMILTSYDASLDVPPMTEWDPADMQRHLECLRSLNAELAANGELVEMNALTGPELAKVVTADGANAPVVTDGPFPEAKELLAGYQLVDVESQERALEIAAAVSSAPGPGGRPLRQHIEVRQVMFTFSGDL
ncbi:MAG: YciI family protein [Pseudonocardia sp.]|nr:YciI family protein [Pseudonocardia sp.]